MTNLTSPRRAPSRPSSAPRPATRSEPRPAARPRPGSAARPAPRVRVTPAVAPAPGPNAPGPNAPEPIRQPVLTGGARAITIVSALLSVIGLMFVFSTTSVQQARTDHAWWGGLPRQLAFLVAAIAVFALLACTDYRRWRQSGLAVVIVGLVLSLLVFSPLGYSAHGAHRWLRIGPITGQPSELLKLGGVLLLAHLGAVRARRPWTMPMLFWPTVILIGMIAFIVAFLQKDLGTFLLITLGILSVFFSTGIGWTYVLRMGGLGLGGAVALIASEPFRRERVVEFLQHESSSDGVGLQQYQARLALASGHITGVDVGAGRAKWGFLPNAENDFIFAVIGEETGLIGSLIVVGLFVVFAIAGTRIAMRAEDDFGRLLAGGVTALVVGQALVNIAAVIDLVPVTGVPLPFVSEGGTALMVLAAGVGMLVSVGRLGGSARAEAAPTSSPSGRARARR
jgi:cell division protein FtsW